jgi:hypothetical protein
MIAWLGLPPAMGVGGSVLFLIPVSLAKITIATSRLQIFKGRQTTF